jgi:O-antigen/teichoic acid export membrane protein
MSEPSSIPPPIGAAPENEDYAHPWIITGVVSAICFVIGFVVLYSTGLWSNFWQWADAPFLFYTAILTPVLLGFYCYGIFLLISRVFGIGRRKQRSNPTS